MPVDWSRYPADWKQISLRIREREGWRCKWCGALNRQPHPDTGSVVVLTVAHLGTPHADGTPGDKHDKLDVRDENLAALCQRCHLNYDRDEHMANAAETRRRKKLEAGQAEMEFARTVTRWGRRTQRIGTERALDDGEVRG